MLLNKGISNILIWPITAELDLFRYSLIKFPCSDIQIHTNYLPFVLYKEDTIPWGLFLPDPVTDATAIWYSGLGPNFLITLKKNIF